MSKQTIRYLMDLSKVFVVFLPGLAMLYFNLFYEPLLIFSAITGIVLGLPIGVGLGKIFY